MFALGTCNRSDVCDFICGQRAKIFWLVENKIGSVFGMSRNRENSFTSTVLMPCKSCTGARHRSASAIQHMMYLRLLTGIWPAFTRIRTFICGEGKPPIFLWLVLKVTAYSALLLARLSSEGTFMTIFTCWEICCKISLQRRHQGHAMDSKAVGVEW